MPFKPALAAQNSNSSVNIVLAKFSFDVMHIFVMFSVNQYCLRMGFLRPSKLFKSTVPEPSLPIHILPKIIVSKKKNNHNPSNFEMIGHF